MTLSDEQGIISRDHDRNGSYKHTIGYEGPYILYYLYGLGVWVGPGILIVQAVDVGH